MKKLSGWFILKNSIAAIIFPLLCIISLITVSFFLKNHLFLLFSAFSMPIWIGLGIGLSFLGLFLYNYSIIKNTKIEYKKNNQTIIKNTEQKSNQNEAQENDNNEQEKSDEEKEESNSERNEEKLINLTPAEQKEKTTIIIAEATKFPPEIVSILLDYIGIKENSSQFNYNEILFFSRNLSKNFYKKFNFEKFYLENHDNVSINTLFHP